MLFLINGLKNTLIKTEIIYVDYFTSMADERNGLKVEYSDDGVHPNELGYNVMAPLVEKAIVEALVR